MRLDDDFDNDDRLSSNTEYSSRSSYIIYTVVGASVVMLLIVAAVLASNGGFNKNKVTPTISDGNADSYKSEVTKSVDELISGSTLTAQDLDFWHDYDEEKEPAMSVDEVKEEDIVPENPLDDGRHTKITYADGKEEWIDINPYLALNTYNYSNLVYTNGIMKYYDNYVKSSYAGLDLSKYDDYVDFNRVKRAGIDYVMLKVGQRGYSTGELSLDDNFTDNIKRASAAGLDIGAYFFSQAITKEEAIEEAEYVIDTLSGNSIKYPVVFYMEDLDSKDVRTQNLNQLLRTNIAIAFMDRIREAGYVPMIYGNKEYLLKKVSFGSLIGYDVWVAQDQDVPDFPYEFNMWEYDRDAKINGVPGNARVSISFVDYSVR